MYVIAMVLLSFVIDQSRIGQRFSSGQPFVTMFWYGTGIFPLALFAKLFLTFQDN